MTELARIYYDRDTYFETSTGNKIAKDCGLNGSVNLVLNGKCIVMDKCILRGDLNMIRMGKYCIVKQNCVIRPSYKLYPNKGLMFFTIGIGENVIIEENCVIMAVYVGAFTHIGANAIIGRGAHIKECCQVLPNTIIPPNTSFPSFSIIGGNPGRVVGELPMNFQAMMTEMTLEFYEKFTPKGTGQL
uniref:Dynactin subunit 5 n=1 Tax=Rhabditophanes sp. KR3021 TaxID=114890 RepID=A0AC35TTU4_9BILA